MSSRLRIKFQGEYTRLTEKHIDSIKRGRTAFWAKKQEFVEDLSMLLKLAATFSLRVTEGVIEVDGETQNVLMIK